MRLTFLITSGPTREYFDPVRFISNASSGKMGRELAQAALKTKNNVIMVTGPCPAPKFGNLKLIPVVSALEMFKKVKENLPQADIVIGAAAVSDWRPEAIAKEKIKKSSKSFSFNLAQNPDILKYVGQIKKDKISIGFALESKGVLNNAIEKLYIKNLDLIVANKPDAIGSDRLDAYMIFKDQKIVKLKNITKKALAEKIVNESIRIWKNHHSC